MACPPLNSSDDQVADTIRTACFRMAEFLASSPADSATTAQRTLIAMRDAITAGASVTELAAALGASPHTVRSLLTGTVALNDLHPSSNSHTPT